VILIVRQQGRRSAPSASPCPSAIATYAGPGQLTKLKGEDAAIAQPPRFAFERRAASADQNCYG
jgi:hypothetical protein